MEEKDKKRLYSSGHLAQEVHRVPMSSGIQLARTKLWSWVQNECLHLAPNSPLLLQTRNGKWIQGWKLLLPFSTLRHGRKRKAETAIWRPKYLSWKASTGVSELGQGGDVRRQRQWFSNHQLIISISYIQQCGAFLFVLSIQSSGDVSSSTPRSQLTNRTWFYQKTMSTN